MFGRTNRQCGNKRIFFYVHSQIHRQWFYKNLMFRKVQVRRFLLCLWNDVKIVEYVWLLGWKAGSHGTSSLRAFDQLWMSRSILWFIASIGWIVLMDNKGRAVCRSWKYGKIKALQISARIWRDVYVDLDDERGRCYASMNSLPLSMLLYLSRFRKPSDSCWRSKNEYKTSV
jgi:hypothetical protein